MIQVQIGICSRLAYGVALAMFQASGANDRSLSSSTQLCSTLCICVSQDVRHEKHENDMIFAGHNRATSF